MTEFTFDSRLRVRAFPALDNATLRGLWQGFTAGCCDLQMDAADGYILLTEGKEAPLLPEGKEYRVVADAAGLAIAAQNAAALARAWITLMMKIRMTDCADGHGRYAVAACDYCDAYALPIRMIHFCVFPETSYNMLHRLIRLAGVMQYTHVCIEFWGMLRYETLPELGWESAYTKEEIRPLLQEIRDMGAEPVPMFNSLGHASSCRGNGGKHVVLDQAPRYDCLFTPDGSVWDIRRENVRTLLACVRRELCDLFGEGAFFHVGCDEVLQSDPDFLSAIPDYLAHLTEDVRQMGRAAIMWGDGLMCHENCGADEIYCCLGKSPEAALRNLRALAPGTVIADWQYEFKEPPAKTSAFLAGQGFRVLGCPWFKEPTQDAFLQTPCLSGVMLTTWHTLGVHLDSVVTFARKCGAVLPHWYDSAFPNAVMGALYRKIAADFPSTYTERGWQEHQYHNFDLTW